MYPASRRRCASLAFREGLLHQIPVTRSNSFLSPINYIKCTSFLPFITSPITLASFKVFKVVFTASFFTTAIMPMPMLKESHISASGMAPRRCISRIMGGTVQEAVFTTAAVFLGSTRGRLPGMPEPVMWARARMSWPCLRKRISP